MVIGERKLEQFGRVVRAGQVWSHYKGGTYFVVAVSTHTETGEGLVTYRLTNDSSEFWTRPLEMFLGKIESGSWRFVRRRIMEQQLLYRLSAMGIQVSGPDPEGRRDWHTSAGRYLGTFDTEQGWQAVLDMIDGALPK